MIVGIKHFRSALIGVAVIATLFGLVQAPLMASAMHAGMMDAYVMDMPASDMLMTPAFMSVDAHGTSGCSDTNCSPEAACLQHCLEQATSRDAEAVPAPSAAVHAPAILPQRVTYPEENPDAIHSDQTLSHTDAREILLTTHKRE